MADQRVLVQRGGALRAGEVKVDGRDQQTQTEPKRRKETHQRTADTSVAITGSGRSVRSDWPHLAASTQLPTPSCPKQANLPLPPEERRIHRINKCVRIY